MNSDLIQTIKIISGALITIFISCCICGCSEKSENYAAPAAETSSSSNERNETSALQNHSEKSQSVDLPNEESLSISSWLNKLFDVNSDDENKDSDGDTLIDSDEIVLGLDPNNPKTFGTPDAEYKVKQTIAPNSSSLTKVNITDGPYTLSLEITASGNVERTLTAGKSAYSNVIDSDMQLGNSIDLKYFGGEISEVTLHFTIGGEHLENELNVFPDEKELQGVRRFNVFKYFEDINMLLPIETTIDEETNTISATVDELGTYSVIDMEKWFFNLSEFPEEPNAE